MSVDLDRATAPRGRGCWRTGSQSRSASCSSVPHFPTNITWRYLHVKSFPKNVSSFPLLCVPRALLSILHYYMKLDIFSVVLSFKISTGQTDIISLLTYVTIFTGLCDELFRLISVCQCFLSHGHIRTISSLSDLRFLLNYVCCFV